MNNDYQASPPSYTDCTEKSVHYGSKDRGLIYVVPPTEESDTIKFTTTHEILSDVNGVQNAPMVPLGELPVQCICLNCHCSIITHTKQTPGLLVWGLCLLILLFGCWLGCCLIPFCIRGIQNTQHYCPHCRILIGECRRL